MHNRTEKRASPPQVEYSREGLENCTGSSDESKAPRGVSSASCSRNLGGISTISAWWSASLSGISGSGTLDFLPGNSLSASIPGASASATYASEGLGQVGALYEGILVFGILAMVFSFIAGIVGFL